MTEYKPIKGHWGYGAVETPPDMSQLQSRGFPTSGDPARAVPATKPRAAWYYLMDQMRLSVIAAAGEEPEEPPDPQQFIRCLASLKWAENGGVSETLIADAAVTNAKIALRSVSADRLATPLDLNGAGVDLVVRFYAKSALDQKVLARGELAADIENFKLYLGDGVTPGGHPIAEIPSGFGRVDYEVLSAEEQS